MKRHTEKTFCFYFLPEKESKHKRIKMDKIKSLDAAVKGIIGRVKDEKDLQNYQLLMSVGKDLDQCHHSVRSFLKAGNPPELIIAAVIKSFHIGTLFCWLNL